MIEGIQKKNQASANRKMAKPETKKARSSRLRATKPPTVFCRDGEELHAPNA
jgi:hypothetical protein